MHKFGWFYINKKTNAKLYKLLQIDWMKVMECSRKLDNSIRYSTQGPSLPLLPYTEKCSNRTTLFGNFFHEQSYSRFQLGWSLAWDQFCRVITNCHRDQWCNKKISGKCIFVLTVPIQHLGNCHNQTKFHYEQPVCMYIFLVMNSSGNFNAFMSTVSTSAGSEWFILIGLGCRKFIHCFV